MSRERGTPPHKYHGGEDDQVQLRENPEIRHTDVARLATLNELEEQENRDGDRRHDSSRSNSR